MVAKGYAYIDGKYARLNIIMPKTMLILEQVKNGKKKIKKPKNKIKNSFNC